MLSFYLHFRVKVFITPSLQRANIVNRLALIFRSISLSKYFGKSDHVARHVIQRGFPLQILRTVGV